MDSNMSRRVSIGAWLCDELVALNIALVFDKRGQAGQ